MSLGLFLLPIKRPRFLIGDAEKSRRCVSRSIATMAQKTRSRSP
jgi:hypothetical protein